MIARANRIAGLVALILGVVALGGCEKPPQVTGQQGFRGTGMVDVRTPMAVEQALARNQVPAALPAAPPSGTKAGLVFQNVKVLGDTDVTEFTRLMNAMTTWVAPKEGCAYCHDVANLADDSKYTKVVARRMIEMTRHINASAKTHVAETGVTCYTCHRGNAVPQYIWHKAAPGEGGMTGFTDGQNVAAPVVGLTSLPYDPFADLIAAKAPAQAIRVAASTALPAGPSRSIKDTEETYGLMMHLSEALGQNCTFCHNTRSFYDWEGNPPRRATAWHGIQMVRDLNEQFLTPLASTLPAERLGPTGDGPKLNCATCHQGASKPLGGVSMLQDYPELR